MKFELDLSVDNDRFVRIRKRDEHVLRVDAGVRSGPGIWYLNKREAQILSKALAAMAEGLHDGDG